jgi:hypothetical protein
VRSDWSWTLLTAFATCGLVASSACGDTKYPAPAVATAPAVAITPVASDPRLDDLEHRVVNIEKQVAAQPTSSVAAAPATWSCAAQCVTKFHCTTNGDSNLSFRRVEATGGTPLAAFKNLTDTCGKDDDLEVDAQCKGGQVQETDATLVNACVKN